LGDSLVPFLFLIVVDRLVGLVKKAKACNLFQEIEMGERKVNKIELGERKVEVGYYNL